MKILVVGAGGVGGYYAAILADHGADVSVVARGEHGRVISESGLSLCLDDRTLTLRCPVFGDLTSAPAAAYDLVLVCVKARGLSEIAPGLSRVLGPDGVVVPVLNGVDSEAIVAEAVGPERVIGSVAQIAAELEGPGRIRVRGGGRLVLAPYAGGPLARVEALAASLQALGVDAKARDDLSVLLWKKLRWNAPFNALCAITRRGPGELLETPELEALIRDAMDEVVAVANAEGVPLGTGDIAFALDTTRKGYSATRPSMLQDVLAGRPTETDALQGAVVKRGEQHGVPTPIHRTLWAIMKGLEPRP